MRFIAALVLSGLLFSVGLRAESISEADLLRHIEILAGDAFEGRKPGTTGENKAVNYIATQWSAAGLKPAGEPGSWYAPVSLVERIPETSQIYFSDTARGKNIRLREDEIILRSGDPSFRQSDMPVVFAGYADPGLGLDAMPVAGKLVLLPINPPDDKNDDASFLNRKRQLIRNGAVGVIAIVDDQKRWPRILRSYQQGATVLTDPEDHAAFEGLINLDQFSKLSGKYGLDAESLLADRATISIVDLGASADATVETQVRTYTSHNVIGKIAGTNPKRGALLYMGHWDHFGECRIEDPLNPDEDRICNGAIDNASGISLLIETAKRLSADDHDRDIYFLATTAEEKGLLGARAFVRNPAVALENLVAVFNADTVALSDDKKLIAVIGLGKSGLDRDIETVAAQEGREIDRSGTSDAYLRRQDGYVFTERDIPAFMITSAFADKERLQAFINGPYHDVSDEVNKDLLLAGAAADANFHVALGRYFSSTGTYPGLATSGGADN
ncbi:M28 family peptidase [Parasphingorhabdus sp.]|uniref:M28 family peptidase n=1 Tax=Parasphingorhabdus sp. TaxID=2709688 RepID=UPI00300308EC